MSPKCLPPSFDSIRLTIREQMRFEDFQDGHLGGHLRYRNESLCRPEASLQVLAQSALQFGRRCRFKKFLDGRRGGQLGYWFGTNLTVLNFHVSSVRTTKFQLNPNYLSGTEVVQDFQDSHHGDHLAYWDGSNLPILNIHSTPMPPTKFGLNPTYRSEADVVWRFSKWPPWQPSWISVFS